MKKSEIPNTCWPRNFGQGFSSCMSLIVSMSHLSLYILIGIFLFHICFTLFLFNQFSHQIFSLSLLELLFSFSLSFLLLLLWQNIKIILFSYHLFLLKLLMSTAIIVFSISSSTPFTLLDNS